MSWSGGGTSTRVCFLEAFGHGEREGERGGFWLLVWDSAGERER